MSDGCRSKDLGTRLLEELAVEGLAMRFARLLLPARKLQPTVGLDQVEVLRPNSRDDVGVGDEFFGRELRRNDEAATGAWIVEGGKEVRISRPERTQLLPPSPPNGPVASQLQRLARRWARCSTPSCAPSAPSRATAAPRGSGCPSDLPACVPGTRRRLGDRLADCASTIAPRRAT